MSCINKNLKEYRALKGASGLSDASLINSITQYQKVFNTDEFPPLEFVMVKNSSSKEALGEYFKGKVQESTLVTTSEISLVEANQKFRDLSIDLDEVYNNRFYYKVDQKATYNRPKQTLPDISERNQGLHKTKVDSIPIFKLCQNIQSRLGVDIDVVSQQEFDEISPISNANGIIKDGVIYINNNSLTEETKVHELFHLLLAPIKVTNYPLYEKFLDLITGLDETKSVLNQYKNMSLSRNDMLEEAFVSIISKYVNNTLSEKSKSVLDANNINILLYELSYVLDSNMDLDYPTTKVNFDNLKEKSLKDLILTYDANTLLDISSYSPSLASESRKVTNIKSDLLKDGYLEENCE